MVAICSLTFTILLYPKVSKTNVVQSYCNEKKHKNDVIFSLTSISYLLLLTFTKLALVCSVFFFFSNSEHFLLAANKLHKSSHQRLKLCIYIWYILSKVVFWRNVSVTDINDIFKFLLTLLFALVHICCLTRCHWFLLVISIVCALEYIKHPKTTIAPKFGFVQVKFKLFRERLQYAV